MSQPDQTPTPTYFQAERARFVAFYRETAAAAMADGDLPSVDYYKGAVAGLLGRRTMSRYFLTRNAQATFRGAAFNEGHEIGRRRLYRLLNEAEAKRDAEHERAQAQSAITLRPTGDEYDEAA